jgi:putative redox protein
VAAKPPSVAHLAWDGDLKFSAILGKTSMSLDSAGITGPSPVDALVVSLAGCMSTDIVHILTRGRHPLRALRSCATADRAQENPHRLLRVALAFTIEGDVPTDAVDRAIALSREKYCSVWHSMRQDVDLTVTFELLA